MAPTPPDRIAELQTMVVQLGRWLDRDEAIDLWAQTAHGDLSEDRFMEELTARSRPLTPGERSKLVAAGVEILGCERAQPVALCKHKICDCGAPLPRHAPPKFSDEPGNCQCEGLVMTTNGSPYQLHSRWLCKTKPVAP